MPDPIHVLNLTSHTYLIGAFMKTEKLTWSHHNYGSPQLTLGLTLMLYSLYVWAMVCLHSTRQCVLTALKMVCPLCVKILCTQRSLWCLHSLTTVDILLLIVLPCLILIRIIKVTALENYIVLFIWKLSYISGISLKLMVYIADYSFSRIKHFL